MKKEKELINLIAEGDEYAFSLFFDEYRDRIYSISFKLTKSTYIAEEIVQDVFLNIWLKRADLINIQDLSAYLFIVTRNAVYKELKRIARNYKITSLTDEDQSLSNNNSTDLVMNKEYDLLLKKAIEQLPHQQKHVYRLMKEQGLKREEVACLLNLQPETIKSHLTQAMKNIRAFCLLHLNMCIALTTTVVCLIYRIRK